MHRFRQRVRVRQERWGLQATARRPPLAVAEGNEVITICCDPAGAGGEMLVRPSPISFACRCRRRQIAGRARRDGWRLAARTLPDYGKFATRAVGIAWGVE